jgi:hypothetical protein
MGPKMQQTKEDLVIHFDTKGLNPAQVRTIRSLVATLSNLMSTKEEGEFFESSAEMLRLAASLVQQAAFPNNAKANASEVPYAVQALEYSVDMLTDHMSSAKVLKYDN